MKMNLTSTIKEENGAWVATDAMEALAVSGLRTVLFLSPPNTVSQVHQNKDSHLELSLL